LNVAPILRDIIRTLVLFSGAITCCAGAHAGPVQYTPVKWERFVKVEGQPLPVPEQWLPDEEARIAHSLKLPDAVPKPVPFDFDKARRKSWLPGNPSVKLQYFNHLCSTEAGEWIFRKVQNVEGLYFARPQNGPFKSGYFTDPYGPEMPWMERVLFLTGERLDRQGGRFVQPPHYNYRFVEQPKRNVPWQKGIAEPYVSLFGYTSEAERDQAGKLTRSFREKTPMQVVGVSQPTAQYGYTWRGVRRDRDRENSIAGGEVLIYDLQTRAVIAVRRQFLITGKNHRGRGEAVWEVAASCMNRPSNGLGAEFTQFAFDVLQTTEPSTTGKLGK
jgi:hypothetical protein